MKRTYVYDPELGLVEITRRPPEAKVHLQTDAGFEGLQATDGTDISSRSKWNAYAKENNLTLASDFTKTWEKAAQERVARATPGSGHGTEERREAIRRALEMNPRDVRNLAERAREKARDHHLSTPTGRGWED